MVNIMIVWAWSFSRRVSHSSELILLLFLVVFGSFFVGGGGLQSLLHTICISFVWVYTCHIILIIAFKWLLYKLTIISFSLYKNQMKAMILFLYKLILIWFLYHFNVILIWNLLQIISICGEIVYVYIEHSLVAS